MPFERWTRAIDDATDTPARQALLAEIGQWRAKNLTDIPGQREAAFAIARLHQLLGDPDGAQREARSLLSLCQTEPVASASEQQAAAEFLQQLGGPAPKAAPSAQPEHPLQAALQAALDGDLDRARALLKNRKKAQIARVWIDVLEAVRADDPRPLLTALEARLRRHLPLPRTEKLAGPVERLLGRTLPRRIADRRRVLFRWLHAHPEGADALGAAVLDPPPEGPPWFIPFVALGLARGGERTTAALEALGDDPVAAMFREAPFLRAVELIRAAPERFTDLRRGLLRRGAEPPDRTAWALHLDDRERMLVLVPHHAEPYPEDLARSIADRLPKLCSRFVILAPGAANRPLRETLAEAGYVTLDGEPSDRELLSVVDRVEPVEPAPAPASEPASPPPDHALRKLLTAEALPTETALVEALEQLPKLRDGFLLAATLWSASLPPDASARVAPMLRAAHALARPQARIPEATTLAFRVAIAQGGPTRDALLTSPTAERFGGPGAEDLLAILGAAAEKGWSIWRVFRGVRRLDLRRSPALRALSPSLDGLWRIELRNGDARAFLWFVATLSPEDRAALPQLLLRATDPVVVLPVDAELSAWYATLDAPPPLGWTGTETDAITDALAVLEP